MADSEPVEVYSAIDIYEAHLVKSMLDEAGIMARIVGDHLQNAIGDLPAVKIAPRIWVNAEFFDKARAVIEAYENTSPPPTQTSSAWTCTKCGEDNEPSFDICWNCQATRNADA